MDTISASNILGLVYYLYEKSVITSDDVGFELAWGDTRAAARLLEMMGRCQGLGVWMAQGSRRLAAHFHAEQEAVQVNGLEVAYHDPRGVSGMALVYATSPRGACHNKSDYFFVDWGQADSALGLELHPRHAGAEKAANVARHQDWRTVCDALVMCLFANVPPEMVADLVNAACGYDLTVEEMLRCGERGWTIKRVINHRLGLTRANDRLPKALLEPLTDGPSAGFVPDLAGMLDAYYRVRRWDAATGRPTVGLLQALGMEDVWRDLWG
jgi:aldehyde:ferredoxin oxidoreductase